MKLRREEYLKKIREKNRKLILKNALKLFAKYSFTKTTVDQIAQKSGISKGLIYNYFSSKEEILITLLNDGIEKIIANLEKYSELRSEQDLKDVIDIIIKTIISNKEFFKLYFSLFNENILSRKYQKTLIKDMNQIAELFATYYKNKNEKNPYLLAYTLLSALDGLAIDYLTLSNSLPIKQMANVLYEKFK